MKKKVILGSILAPKAADPVSQKADQAATWAKAKPGRPSSRGPADGWVRLAIDLPVDVRRRLKLKAAETDTTVADLVRKAIDQVLAKG